jgi:DNA invertase Pin-like site-specific DNA recombinase
MSKGKKEATGNRAAACIRMSTDIQAKSPDQQRAEVKRLAESLGLNLVAEYFDAGISGADTKRRERFLQMITDAEDGQFDAILAWDVDRFSRADVLEANAIWYRLREAGVRVFTVNQGDLRLDSSDIGHIITRDITQHGKHAYLVDLSRNALRGALAAVNRGQWPGLPPFGYDRQFYDQNGRPVHRAPFGTKFQKPTEWLVKLVPSEDETAVETVRWIFQQYVEHGEPLNNIARMLNRKGAQSASGGSWWQHTVRTILLNPAYVGDLTYGKFRCGKFHQTTDGGLIGEATQAKRSTAPVIIKDAHPALVSREIFEAARQRIKSESFALGRRGSYPLSSILRCGHCGASMIGYHSDTPATKGLRFYCCSNRGRIGAECRGYSVSAERIERFVLDELVATVLSDENIERMSRRAIEKEAATRKKPGIDSAALERKITALERKIPKGSENILLAPTPQVAEAAGAKLAEWQRELAELKSQREAKPGGKRRRTLNATAETFRKLRDAISDRSNIHRSREALLAIFARIDLFWKLRETSGRDRAYLDRATIRWHGAGQEATEAAERPTFAHSFANESLDQFRQHEVAAEIVRKLAKNGPVSSTRVAKEAGKSKTWALGALRRARLAGLITSAIGGSGGYLPTP